MSTTTPLHFGPSDAPLFGTYHGPGAPRPSSPGIVLCPPFGTEHLLSHALLLRVADTLAQEGYHVLRFDWTGSGDSAGDAEQVRLATWSADLEAALDELRDMSGSNRLAVIGTGLGSAVAVQVAASRRDIRQVVAWDPVIRGADYLRWLSHVAREPAVLDAGRRDLVGVFGVPMPAPFRQEVMELDLTAQAAALGTRLTLVAIPSALGVFGAIPSANRIALPEDVGTMERALRSGHIMLEHRVSEALLAAIRQSVPC